MLYRQSEKNSGGRVSRSFGMWVIVHGGRGGGTHASTRANRYLLLLLEYYTTRIPRTLLHESRAVTGPLVGAWGFSNPSHKALIQDVYDTDANFSESINRPPARPCDGKHAEAGNLKEGQ